VGPLRSITSGAKY